MDGLSGWPRIQVDELAVRTLNQGELLRCVVKAVPKFSQKPRLRRTAQVTGDGFQIHSLSGNPFREFQQPVDTLRKAEVFQDVLL
jgi:hypothetical protein